MKSLEEILREPVKWKKGYNGKNYYNCIHKNSCTITAADLKEWKNSAAGIDNN